MGADKEITQHVAFRTAATPITDKRLAGQEERWPRDFKGTQRHAFHHAVQRFDGRERQRELRIDDGIDREPMDLSAAAPMLLGPSTDLQDARGDAAPLAETPGVRQTANAAQASARETVYGAPPLPSRCTATSGSQAAPLVAPICRSSANRVPKHLCHWLRASR